MDKTKLRQIDFEKLLNFYTIFREGSISKASQVSGTSRRTYYHDLAVLEKAFDTKLYLGGKKNFVLTEEGKKLADFCKNSLTELQLVKESESSFTEGKIVIHTTIGISSYYFTRVLKEFNEKYPDIKIDILAGPEYFGSKYHDFDLSVGPYLEDTGGLSQNILSTYEYGYFASKEYLKKHGEPKTEKELRNHRILCFAGVHLLPKDIINDSNIIIKSNSYPTLLELCEQGLGIGSLSLHLTLSYIRNEPQGSKLVRILPNIISETDNIYYSFPRYSPKEKVIRYLCQMLKDIIKSETLITS